MRKIIGLLILAISVAIMGVACGGSESPNIQELRLSVYQPVTGQTVAILVVVEDSDTSIFDLVFNGEVLRGDGPLTKDIKVVNKLHYKARVPGEHILRVVVIDPQGNSDERTFSIIFSPQ